MQRSTTGASQHCLCCSERLKSPHESAPFANRPRSIAINCYSTVGHILDHTLTGADITVDEATSLFDADGSDLPALTAAADDLRAKTVGDVVTYVVNRNINFTTFVSKPVVFALSAEGIWPKKATFCLPRKLSGAQTSPRVGCH